MFKNNEQDVKATGLEESDPRLQSVFKRLQADAFHQYSGEEAKYEFVE